MLQIRISVPDFTSGVAFTDQVILENADSISLRKTINTADETISFSVPINDPKGQYITYLRWWECWDTDSNTRLNYGPITTIDKSSGEVITVNGSGRPALLKDFYRTIQTFYEYQDYFVDDLRFEDVTAEPRTRTFIDKSDGSDYYGLSKRTKDNAIDEQTGLIAPGRDTPNRGTIKTKSFWTGTGKADFLIIDLGETVDVSRSRLLLPWWGGATSRINRAYDYTLQVSDSKDSGYSTWYSSPVPNRGITRIDSPRGGRYFTLGDTLPRSTALNSASPISGRYWKIDITDTHAWYQATVDNPVDEYDWECLGSDVFKGNAKQSPTDGTIPKQQITPVSDCHAGVVEWSLMRKILDRDFVTSTGYTQIDGDNWQIKYHHSPDSSEMITTSDSTVRKFEPGGYFRKVTLSGSGTMTVTDEYNTVVYVGGAGTIDLPAYCSTLKIAGSSNSQVTFVDAFKEELDPLSYDRSYSYTTITGDYAILTFRGVSVKWYATVPSGKTSANVKIELRSKDDNTGSWSAWSTLDPSFALGTNFSAQKVWEITYESNTLQEGTTYQLRLTNLNGGYMSIDSFTGYWEASFTMYNEDDPRYLLKHPQLAVQEYSEKYFGASIYKFDDSKGSGIQAQEILFSGDRIVVLSKKGPGLGTMVLELRQPGLYGSAPVTIPGGNSDGTLTINLDHTQEIPQAIVFDTDDYFDALPFANYHCIISFPDAGTGNFYIDAMGVHEIRKLTVKFINTEHLEILKSVCEALQLEWDINENGLRVVPRIGTDTNVVMKEGTNTTIKIDETQDVEGVATQLLFNGGDIDGLPLTGIVEDKNNRKLFGRTIQREYDINGITDYFTLIGAARTELRRRKEPEERITVTHIGDLEVSEGDSFKIKTAYQEKTVRVNTITREQSRNNGLVYTLECVTWPRID